MSSIIIDFSKQGAFGPEAVEAMGKAYELGCTALVGRAETDKEKLARRIIELAQDGLLDPAQLSVAARQGSLLKLQWTLLNRSADRCR